MSVPDYTQTIEDHLSLLILVKQVGSQLKPKAYNQLYERISRVQSVQIHSQQRTLRLRYAKTYPTARNEWGDFQGHRRAIGLICLGRCESESEVSELYTLYEDLDQAYSPTLYDSRLVLYGLNKDGSVLEQRLLRGLTGEELNGHANKAKDSASNDGKAETTDTADGAASSKESSPKHRSSPRSSLSPRTSPKQRSSLLLRAQNLDNFKPLNSTSRRHQQQNAVKNTQRSESTQAPHVICYAREDACPDLEEQLQDYFASLFWILESKRLDRSHERQEKPPLLMTPFERRDLVGVDTDSRVYKKRCQGRLRKHLGDLCLLAGLPGEALLHYQTSLDILKSANDYMWLAGAYEGICAATVAISQPKTESTAFPRNLSFSSFSVKRGSSSSKDKQRPGEKKGLMSRSLTNGIDLDDSRQRTTLAVDDIIEKFREAILNYSKFTHAGVIEMETSIKACRIATEHDIERIETERHQMITASMDDLQKSTLHVVFDNQRLLTIKHYRALLAREAGEMAPPLGIMPPFGMFGTSPGFPPMIPPQFGMFPTMQGSPPQVTTSTPNNGRHSPNSSLESNSAGEQNVSPKRSRETQGEENESPRSNKRRFLSQHAVGVLCAWYEAHYDHPYPDDQDVDNLARTAGITTNQVKKWMANKRVRSCNTLAFNGSIHPKKLQKLMQLKDSSPVKDGSSPSKIPPQSRLELAFQVKQEAAGCSADKKSKRLLSPSAVDYMTQWYSDHINYPYPTEAEKALIAADTGLSLSQVTCWFANKRNRSNNTRKTSSKVVWQKLNRKMQMFDNMKDRMPANSMVPLLPPGMTFAAAPTPL